MTAAASTASTIPRTFIWRRLHSLMGLWFLLFLIEHLLTNSQATLWLGDNGREFIKMVDGLHNLPYLQVIELVLLGVPILIHVVLGVKYLFTAKFVAGRSDGSVPTLRLPRNRAYKWQRITSWILLIGLIGHVAKFRFLEYPEKVHLASETVYMVKISMDEGLYTLADRLKVKLYDQRAIEKEAAQFQARSSERALVEAAQALKNETIDPWTGPIPENYNEQKAIILASAQQYQLNSEFISALEKEKLSAGEVIAAVPDFGTATLLSVRDAFKQPIYIGLYTIFVIAACFHGCNGFWTFLITWGLILKMAAQRAWVTVSVVLMAILLFLGLAAVWGSYWINLRY